MNSFKPGPDGFPPFPGNLADAERLKVTALHDKLKQALAKINNNRQAVEKVRTTPESKARVAARRLEAEVEKAATMSEATAYYFQVTARSVPAPADPLDQPFTRRDFMAFQQQIGGI